MRHLKKGRKLGRTAAHRKAMLRNLVCNLFLAQPKGEGPRRVTTTIPKAKEARRVAERAITLGKRATLHARRRAVALLGSKRVVKLLFEELAPLYSGRDGGYTRVIRLARARVGDGADLCYFELVSGPVEAKKKAAEPVAPKVADQPPTAAQEPPEEAPREAEPESNDPEAEAAGAGDHEGDAADSRKEQPS